MPPGPPPWRSASAHGTGAGRGRFFRILVRRRGRGVAGGRRSRAMAPAPALRQQGGHGCGGVDVVFCLPRTTRCRPSTAPVHSAGTEECSLLMDRAKEVQPESESFPPPASTGPGSTQRLPLPAAEAWLAAIIESSDDAIVSKTLQGIITSWNKGAERLFGFTAEEAVGQPIIMIIPPERQEEERLILQRLRSGERIEHFETIRRAKDGRLIEVSLTVSPIRDSSGRIVGASKIARDITLRKRAEATLREADRRKDAFIAILSHELRNPLAPVLHSTEVLLRDPGLGETARQLGGVILRQARYMARLIDDLLDSSRLDTGKVRLHKTRVELDAVVGVAVEINRARIDGQRLALKLAVPSGITLFADRDRLVQVLANLLNNAVKFTEPGGSIEIHAAAAQEWLVLRVRDTGIGIEPDKLGTIFD